MSEFVRTFDSILLQYRRTISDNIYAHRAWAFCMHKRKHLVITSSVNTDKAFNDLWDNTFIRDLVFNYNFGSQTFE